MTYFLLWLSGLLGVRFSEVLRLGLPGSWLWSRAFGPTGLYSKPSRPGQAPTENLLLSYFLFMALGLLVFDFLLWLHVLLFLDLQGPCWVEPADPEGFRPSPRPNRPQRKIYRATFSVDGPGLAGV